MGISPALRRPSFDESATTADSPGQILHQDEISAGQTLCTRKHPVALSAVGASFRSAHFKGLGCAVWGNLAGTCFTLPRPARSARKRVDASAAVFILSAADSSDSSLLIRTSPESK